MAPIKTTPPIVPVMKAFESVALGFGGSISVGEAKILKAVATTPEAKAALKEMLAHDTFDKGAAEILKKPAGKLDEARSSMAGVKLGALKSGGVNLDVTVTRELGPTAGYANKWQAAGAARASGQANTAVIADDHKPPRWHAVQTNLQAGVSKAYTPATTQFSEVVPLTAPATQQRFDDLKSDLRKANKAYEADSSDANWEKVKTAYTTLAAETYGLDPKEFNVIRNPADVSATQVNLMWSTPHGQAYFGDASSNTQALPTDGTARSPHGVVLGFDAFRNQIQAGGALTHEATHKEHHDLGDALEKEWKHSKDKGTTKKDFTTWLDTQVPKRISADQKEVVLEQITNKATPQTELSAYTNELAATFGQYPANDLEAKMTLQSVHDRLGALGADDQATLKALYNSLDEDHRKVFEQYLPKPK